MIKSLQIRNYALIESLDIVFPPGLTVITGETGAGKSILLGALGLVMGQRADSRALFDEELKCAVEACFAIAPYGLAPFFERHRIGYSDDLVIRRELTPAGKSRSFVNDTPVTIKVLQDLSAELIDLHQQFDTGDIQDSLFQMKMVDALAGNASRLAKYRVVFSNWSNLVKQREEILQMSQATAREISFLEFQLDELSRAELIPGEEDSLEETLSRLSHAEDIRRGLSLAVQVMEEDESPVLGRISEVVQALNQIRRFDEEVGALYERLVSLQIELRDWNRDAERRAEGIDFDPDQLRMVQDRLDMLNRLLQKHQVQSSAELIQLREDLSSRLASFANRNMDIADLESRIAGLFDELEEIATDLSTSRRAVLPAFQEKIHQRLSLLALENARLEIQCEATERPGPYGKDQFQFLFSANKGSRLLPISDVASGGELSRLSLVVKSLVATSIPLPTLVFDEIDAGVSGDVALKMGNILRELSNGHQVITITHSPQVAARADTHYFVYKEDTGNRTVTALRPLDQEGRVFQLACMLSQHPPGPFALENARELLGL